MLERERERERKREIKREGGRRELSMLFLPYPGIQEAQSIHHCSRPTKINGQKLLEDDPRSWECCDCDAV